MLCSEASEWNASRQGEEEGGRVLESTKKKGSRSLATAKREAAWRHSLTKTQEDCFPTTVVLRFC